MGAIPNYLATDDPKKVASNLRPIIKWETKPPWAVLTVFGLGYLAKQIQILKSSIRHLSNDSREDPSVCFFFWGGMKFLSMLRFRDYLFYAIKINLSMQVFTHSTLWETLPIFLDCFRRSHEIFGSGNLNQMSTGFHGENVILHGHLGIHWQPLSINKARYCWWKKSG